MFFGFFAKKITRRRWGATAPSLENRRYSRIFGILGCNSGYDNYSDVREVMKWL